MKIWIGQSTRIAERWWLEAKSDSACLYSTLLPRPLHHLDSYTYLIATFQNNFFLSDTVAAAKLAKPSHIRTSLFHVHHIRYTCVYDLLTEKCTHNKYASHFSISQPRFTRVFSNELRKPNMISTDSCVMMLLLYKLCTSHTYCYCPADQVISDWWRDRWRDRNVYHHKVHMNRPETPQVGIRIGHKIRFFQPPIRGA